MIPKILLIEDNPDDIALTRHALEKSGFAHELVVISDGREALDYLLRQGAYISMKSRERPDLIILDLHLPLLSGFELLERLKTDKTAQVIPVVVLTISSNPDDVLRSYDLGAVSCIQKRVTMVEFETSIRDTITYWLGVAKLPPKM